MQKKIVFSMHMYWLMITHIFSVVYSFSFIGSLILLAFVYSYLNQNGIIPETNEFRRIQTLVFFMGAIAAITNLIEYKLREGLSRAVKKEIIIDDDYFSYKDRDENIHTVNWQDVKQIQLMAVKMGFKLTVEALNVKFSLYSYETDPIPISFKKQLQRAKEDWMVLKNFQRQNKDTLDKAEYKKRYKEHAIKNMISHSGQFFMFINALKEKAVSADIRRDFVVRSLHKSYPLI